MNADMLVRLYVRLVQNQMDCCEAGFQIYAVQKISRERWSRKEQKKWRRERTKNFEWTDLKLELMAEMITYLKRQGRGEDAKMMKILLNRRKNVWKKGNNKGWTRKTNFNLVSQCPQTLVDEINLRNVKKLDSPLSI